MKYLVILSSLLTLPWISACTTCEKQDPGPASREHMIRSMLTFTAGDTALYWEFFYQGDILDSISVLERNVLDTSRYYYLFRKSGDTTIIFRGYLDGQPARFESYLSDQTGYVKSYLNYDINQNPYFTFSYIRKASGQLDSATSPTYNFTDFTYTGDYIRSYNTYYNNPPGGLEFDSRSDVTYDTTRIRKDGLPVPFENFYGSRFQTMNFLNFGKGSDKLVTSIVRYVNGPLIDSAVYDYPVYTDTLVVCELNAYYNLRVTYTYRYY